MSTILIVASKIDVASVNIAEKIIEYYDFEALPETFRQNPIYYKNVRDVEVKLVIIDEELINAEFISDCFSPQLVIFVSRHSSVSGIPTLSVHTPGNLGDADMGGIPRKVSISPASAMKDVLVEMMRLKEDLGLNYKVSYECTHHGPSLDLPAFFAELGSSIEQWKDEAAAEVVAHATMSAVSKGSSYPAALGVGGPHYNEKFTRIALGTPLAFGHMIPKYAIPLVDFEMVRQCVERTLEKVDLAVFDWKGIRGQDRRRLSDFLSELGVRVEKAKTN